MIGVFKEEAKHRFLCSVQVDGKLEECYVACSSRLTPIFPLENWNVILVPNRGTNLRTKYTLQAAYNDSIQVLLNFNYINELVQKYLCSQYNNVDIKRECYIEKYKADFLLNNNLIIEAKGFLSQTESLIFPIKSSIRAKDQLRKILKLLKKGYNVNYYFILLNPQIINIKIDDSNKEYYNLFLKCMKNGLKPVFFKVKWINHQECWLSNVDDEINMINFNITEGKNRLKNWATCKK